MAAARVRGYRAGGLATAVKHFLGYGAPEAGRDYNGATISTSELHDRYLPPFRAALAAGSETVMAAFNTVNGVPVSADRRLLTGLLRERLGFKGFVTSDFNAIGETTKIAATRDVIKDFAHLVDKIDLKTIDASTTIAADQAFKFIGSVAFHKVAGELNFVKTDLAGTVNDKTIVRGDLNGDGVADFHIELSGLKTLSAADFIL